MKIKIVKTHREGKDWLRAGTTLSDVDKLRAEELERNGIAVIVSDVQTSAQAPKAGSKKKAAPGADAKAAAQDSQDGGAADVQASAPSPDTGGEKGSADTGEKPAAQQE